MGYVGIYYNIPKAIFYLLKGDYIYIYIGDIIGNKMALYRYNYNLLAVCFLSDEVLQVSHAWRIAICTWFHHMRNFTSKKHASLYLSGFRWYAYYPKRIEGP